MEETPDSLPPADSGVAEESAPYGAGDRVLAGVLLAGVALLAYVCMDVLAGGRLTAALSAASPEAPE